MIKEIKIYDLDGTIIDSSHRYRTAKCGTKIDLEHWVENDIPEKIMLDSLLPLAEQYRQDIENPEVFVIVATARACTENDANYLFLKEKLGFPNKFIHRKGREDKRGGAELKLKEIKPLLNLKQFRNAIITVFEDNIAYLKKMCDNINCLGVYVPSKQGH